MNSYLIYGLLIFTVTISFINGAALNTSEILPNEYVREFKDHSIEHPIFYLDYENKNLFVGGGGHILKLKLADITSTNKHHDFNNTDIKIIQPFGINRLFICGVKNDLSTNWIIHKDFQVSLDEGIKWNSPFSLKCGGAKTKTTALMITPNGTTLYSGVSQTIKGDYDSSSIFRTNLKITNNSVLDPIDIQTSHNYHRIRPHGNEDYVGSFDVGDQVLFFFQESGNIDEKKKILIIDEKSTIEHRHRFDIDPAEKIYFRVARVCKNDNGSLDKPRTWTTYVKARLNCPSFETMNSIYKVHDTFFYGTFSTLKVDDNFRTSFDSGICVFHIDDINKAFDGEFMKIEYKGNATSDPVDIPQARPKLCQQDLSNYHNTTGDYLIMDTVIEPIMGGPIFELRNEQSHLTKIVVDKITKSVCGIDVEFIIIYAGTSRGEVYKIVQWTENGIIKSELRDKFKVTPDDEEIEAMEISSNHQSIYVASRNRVKQINLKMCERLKNSPIDPYCELDSDENNCKPIETSPVYVESSPSNVEITTSNVEITTSNVEITTSNFESSPSHVDDLNSVGCYINGYIKQLVCQTLELIEFVRNNSNSACVIKFT